MRRSASEKLEIIHLVEQAEFPVRTTLGSARDRVDLETAEECVREGGCYVNWRERSPSCSLAFLAMCHPGVRHGAGVGVEVDGRLARVARVGNLGMQLSSSASSERTLLSRYYTAGPTRESTPSPTS